MCTPKELVPDVLPGGDNLGVDLGVFWRCFGSVLGVFWACSGGVLAVFRLCSGGILGESPRIHLENPGRTRWERPRTPPEDPQINPQVVSPGGHIGDELLGGTHLAGSN